MLGFGARGTQTALAIRPIAVARSRATRTCSAVGAPAARALWLVFWLSQCYFMLTPANRAPQATSAMIAN